MFLAAAAGEFGTSAGSERLEHRFGERTSLRPAAQILRLNRQLNNEWEVRAMQRSQAVHGTAIGIAAQVPGQQRQLNDAETAQ